jgi:hypothetical protein
MADGKSLSLAQRLQRAGVKKSHAYMIAWGKREPSLPLALKIERESGLKLGPLANVTDEQIAVLREMHGESA